MTVIYLLEYVPNTTYSIIENKETEVLISLSKENIQNLKDIENIKTKKEFYVNYDKLKEAIQAQCLGIKQDDSLFNKIKKLKENILNDKSSNYENKDIEMKINNLINMTKGSLREIFTLDKIKAADLNLKED